MSIFPAACSIDKVGVQPVKRNSPGFRAQLLVTRKQRDSALAQLFRVALILSPLFVGLSRRKVVLLRLLPCTSDSGKHHSPVESHMASASQS